MDIMEFKDFMKRDISPLIQIYDKFYDIKGVRELAYSYKLNYTRLTNIKVPDKCILYADSIYENFDEFIKFRDEVSRPFLFKNLDNDKQNNIRDILFKEIIDMEFTHVYNITESIVTNIDDNKLCTKWHIRGMRKELYEDYVERMKYEMEK